MCLASVVSGAAEMNYIKGFQPDLYSNGRIFKELTHVVFHRAHKKE
jgi:hypothetical protein